MNKGLQRGLVIVLAALSAVLLVLLLRIMTAGVDGQGLTSGEIAIGGPFQLTDQTGKPVSDEDFRGHLMLVYFGYTYCPDVCPTELQAMTAALDQLEVDAVQVQPIFITVDPGRDDAKTLREYVTNFHPTLVGLTGTEDEIAKAARAYRVYYAKAQATADSDNYLMDHSSFIYLMSREGKYLKHFGPNTPPDDMAAAIRKFL